MHKRFSKNVRLILSQIKKQAKETQLGKVDAFEVIKKISAQKGSLGKTMLKSLNVEVEKIDSSYKKLPSREKISANELLKIASKAAYLSNSPYVGTEHLVHAFFSLSQNISLTKSPVAQKKSFGFPSLDSTNKRENFDRPDFFGEVNSIIENFFAPEGASGFKKESALKNFAHDLESDPVQERILIGRERELDRLCHVLGRKMKNNPVLVGEPGVGKTAIVEGLARKISQGDVPYYLLGKKILNLDLGLLIAGTTFRGEFESRLKDVIGEAKKNPDVILFVDEIHNLIGAGNAIGGMDAANLLKPSMSRGEIQIIGATTFDEYQKYIRKDAALERRFQPITVSEPTEEETAKILAGIRPSYEKYHNIKISDKALLSATLLAKRYMAERFLPDSAIDLIDETAAKIRAANSNAPLFEQIKLAEKKIQKIIEDKERYVMFDQYEHAIRLRQEEKKVSDQIVQMKDKLAKMEQKNQIILAETDIRKTLSAIANIPEELLGEENGIITKRVEDILRKNLIGQPETHKEIGNAILRQISGITSPNRPLGSFLFIGPTGVGKTYTAKLLSEAISLQGNKSLIQINMSEFSERHNISRLLGAPAGYVGYDESGEFGEKIRKNPYSVVLFDEIEKAEFSVLNILLQILEEGEISDAKGKTVNFRNTIIILTSNIGASELDSIAKIGFSNESSKAKNQYQKTKELILEQLKEALPPELLNRLDSTIVFELLGKNQIAQITDNELEKLSSRLLQKEIEVVFDKQVSAYVASSSIDDKQGARSVRKTIQDIIEPVIARKLLSKTKPRSIQVKIENGKIAAQAR